MLAEALKEWTPVSTSRPSPEAFLEAYERRARTAPTRVVSVHISGELSGTFESAQLAARRRSVPVRVVDSRQVGMGTGYAVLAAADAIDAGADAAEAAEAARTRAEGTTSLFYVDTLEYLRRGGRMGAAAALLGSALAVKPHPADRGRPGRHPSSGSAPRPRPWPGSRSWPSRPPADAQVDVAVAHLASPERAAQLAERLRERLRGLGRPGGDLGEIGAVLGAHVGPGMVAVAVAPR